MKYGLEMGSIAMIYMPSFVKTRLGIQVGGGGGYTDIQNGNSISLL
jgi:hypothetical protein